MTCGSINLRILRYFIRILRNFELFCVMKAFKMHTRDLKFRRLFAFIFKFKPHHESILCYNSLKRHSSCQISVLELQFASKTFHGKLQLQFQGHFQGRLGVQSFWFALQTHYQ